MKFDDVKNYEYDLMLEQAEIPKMADKRVAVILGRFNPPTKGHYRLFDTTIKFIKSNKNLKLEALPIVVVIGGSSSDKDKTKNPLSIEQRIHFMENSGKANLVKFLSAPNAFAAFSLLREQGYEPIAIAAGPDRIDSYLTLLDKYFKTPDETPIVHHAIELSRSDSAIAKDKEEKKAAIDKTLKTAKEKQHNIDIDDISASLARRAVELGYEEEFNKIVGLEHKPELANKMFKAIAKSLKSAGLN